jgi:transposase
VVDRSRPGRPPTKSGVVANVVGRLLKRDPRRYGYRSPVWTVPLLRQQVERRTGKEMSERTVRRAWRALRYRYKRPSYVLARRSPTWRRAKGG